MIAKLLVLAALTTPLTAAYSRTVHFNCGLNRGGDAVFRLFHEGKIDGVARYSKPSGGVLINHLPAEPCVSSAGCIVIARAKGHAGYKLNYIVEHSTSEFMLEFKKCR